MIVRSEEYPNFTWRNSTSPMTASSLRAFLLSSAISPSSRKSNTRSLAATVDWRFVTICANCESWFEYSRT